MKASPLNGSTCETNMFNTSGKDSHVERETPNATVVSRLTAKRMRKKVVSLNLLKEDTFPRTEVDAAKMRMPVAKPTKLMKRIPGGNDGDTRPASVSASRATWTIRCAKTNREAVISPIVRRTEVS